MTIDALIRLIVMVLAWSLAVLAYIVLWRWINRKLKDDTASLKIFGNPPIFSLVAMIGVLSGFYLWSRWEIKQGTFLAYAGLGVVSWLGGLAALSLLEILGSLPKFMSK